MNYYTNNIYIHPPWRNYFAMIKNGSCKETITTFIRSSIRPYITTPYEQPVLLDHENKSLARALRFVTGIAVNGFYFIVAM